MKHIKWMLALIVMAPVAGWSQTESMPIDGIVALVEEDVILQSELDRALENLSRQLSARGERVPARSIIEEQMLERLILTRLEVLRAEATGIRASDADVDQALERVAQQNSMTLAQLRMAIEGDGIDFQEFRADIREEIITSRLRQRVMNSMDDVTETEVDILMASERFGGPEYLLSQILVALPDSATPDEVRVAQDRANEVHTRLEDGLEFATAAITFSQAPDALEGGEVGWRNLNALPRIFADTLESMQVGQYTRPVRTPAGFVILKVNDVREPADIIVREYRARHLMVEPTELVSLSEAETRVSELHQRLRDGESFEDLARQYSTDESSANIGGLLNWFVSGRYGPRHQQVIDNLEPGELSEPFQTSRGWHILRLEDVRDADRTDVVRRNEAREMLFQQKAEDEIERFLRQLRDESFVEIRL